jgi:hypothetical protein
MSFKNHINRIEQYVCLSIIISIIFEKPPFFLPPLLPIASINNRNFDELKFFFVVVALRVLTFLFREKEERNFS